MLKDAESFQLVILHGAFNAQSEPESECICA